jgi:acetate---CoA ligase (ADP-forming)
VLGRECFPSLLDLPVAADAVVVAIPAAAVPAAIEQAGERGCGGAVVFSAGFAEVAAGVALHEQLVAAATRHRLPVCGPNCNGIVAMRSRAALWGDALEPHEPGAVALISQSGNVAVNALGTRRGLRFHTVIASGNQAVLDASDYLTVLAREDGVRAIALYLEDDGGPGLCYGLAACAESGIRVAVLKVGSSAAGAAAAAAHSGALAGDQRVFRSLIEEAGGVWAADVHELLELAKTLAHRRSAPGAAAPAVGHARLGILTCSGGDSAQSADEAQRIGVELPALAPHTRERLERVLPAAATAANPLDYTAMIWGDVEALAELVAAVGDDPSIDQVLVFYDQPADLDGASEESWAAVREGIIAGAARTAVPVMISSTLPELLDDAAAWRFAEQGVPAAAGLRTGLACAAALAVAPGDPERLRAIARAGGAAGECRAGRPGEWLAEHDSKRLLRDAGVSVVEGRVVAGADDAVAALGELGAPIALKLSSPEVQHKSELGGVELGLVDAPPVRAAYERLAVLAASRNGAVLAERMAPPGVELLVAARVDPVAAVAIVGLGGIWTELLGDVAVVPLPAGAARIERALRSLRGASLLTGGRGRAALDLAAAAALVQRCGEVLLDLGLELIECNPVIVSPAGAVAVDAGIRRPALSR